MQNRHQVYRTGIFFFSLLFILLFYSIIHTGNSCRIFATDKKIETGGIRQSGSGKDTQAIIRTLKENHWLKGKISLISVGRDGNLALIRFTTHENTGKKWLSSALLKKRGSDWKFIDFSGGNPTTDFLRMNSIPSKHWDKLIGQKNIEKSAEIMDLLKRKEKEMYYTNINISGNWAMATWLQDPAGGQTLLKKEGGKWKQLLSDGGAQDRESLKNQGVPGNLINGLMGIEE